tara:strand:+ start:474 stop:644 length:171 start_codon:yes stop_codon:yes gene_type:complete
MSKRNGKNKTKTNYLNSINKIDKRLKRKRTKDDEDETSKLISQRNVIRQKIKSLIT